MEILPNEPLQRWQTRLERGFSLDPKFSLSFPHCSTRQRALSPPKLQVHPETQCSFSVKFSSLLRMAAISHVGVYWAVELISNKS